MKKLFSIKYSDNGISFASFVLRLALGGIIISHGYSKLLSFASKSSTFTDVFHIGSPTSMALVIFAEFFCGVLVVMGLFTRFACIPLIISMSVALFYSHKGQVFGDGEKAALYLAGFIALLFTGPGKFSFDKLVGK